MAREAVALPGRVTDLLARLQAELEKLEKTAPLAVLRAARRMEVVAEAAYWPAREASVAKTAAALCLNEEDAHHLLSRFARWDSRY